jgi:hypothetical protein
VDEPQRYRLTLVSLRDGRSAEVRLRLLLKDLLRSFCLNWQRAAGN